MRKKRKDSHRVGNGRKEDEGVEHASLAQYQYQYQYPHSVQSQSQSHSYILFYLYVHK